jgi:DNA-binding transcriptional regulator YiaG
MNEVQIKIEELKNAGWTKQAVADELGVTWQAVQYWHKGERYPKNSKPVLIFLDSLLKRNPPKKRRYPDGHYLQNRGSELADVSESL